MMKTEKIRERLKKNNIKQWELAKAACISEFTLSRWLRDPVLSKQRAEILQRALDEMQYVRMANKAK